ncbi:ATP-binding protein [Thermodesulfobacteriota bacterium]
MGQIHVPVFHMYDSLARLALYDTDGESRRRQTLSKVGSNLKKLKKWARHAPMNHLHKLHLVQAECLRVKGKLADAGELYDRSIELAKENSFPNEEALATELAGKFFLSRGKLLSARAYMQQARYCYLRWGAKAKVNDMDAKYGDILATSSIPPRPAATSEDATISETSTSGGERIDLTAVMRTSQAISTEIVIGSLLEKLMKIVIENAGAQRGFLIMESDGELRIEARKSPDNSEVTLSRSGSIETTKQLSPAIVNYVARTKKSLVLNDAAAEGAFTNDPYVLANKPRSILCAPLIHQGRLTGVLYLENNLAVGAFSTDRLEMLDLISSQAAISIENAMLYNTLEHKVTERTEQLARAKEKAEVANEAKSAFLAAMSHELRTPLNSILGFTRILARDPSIGQRQLDALETIQRSGNHLLVLINDVLDLAKIEAGKIDLNESTFHLPAFLRDICDIFRIPAEHKGISFTYRPFDFTLDGNAANAPGIRREVLPLCVRGDERRLRQVLINLLGNAVKFTERGRVTLKVGVCRYEDRAETDAFGVSGPVPVIRFQVEDTGIGISPGKLGVIFEPFKQAGHSGESVEGTGLGLSISRSFLKLMGSDLKVESVPAQGSVFRFDMALPAMADSFQQDDMDSGRIVGIRGEKPTILVVDDNPVNRAVITGLLSPLGFEMIEASTGREGLAKAIDCQPDAAIIDLIMPGMDGFQLIRRLRQTPLLEGKFITASSASVLEQDRQRSLDAGADSFIPKPVNPRLLLKQLQQHLSLEWIYESSESDAREVTASSWPAASIPPGEVTALLELTARGDIGALRQRIDALAESDSRLRTITEELRRLAKGFQMTKIRELLESFGRP